MDPKHLPEFVPRFTEIMAKHGADAAYYGHCSVGCLHIRPLINLKTERGLEQVRVMAEEIFDLVLSFGGAISSEHGDGRARSPFLERVFGPTMFRAFQEIEGRLRPARAHEPRQHRGEPRCHRAPALRPRLQDVGAQDPARLPRPGRLRAAVEMCNGVGVCRKKLEGTMCPSYMATRDEEHSTRGRANALRAVLSGKVPQADFAGRRLYEVMDLCLECKGCKAECPSNVDMAKMKYEFLHHYYRVNGLPLRNRMFGHIAKLSWLGSRLAPISNWIARSWPNRLADGAHGRHRPAPPAARASRGETFTDWFDAPARAPGGAAGRRGALPRHVRHLQRARDRPRRGGAAGGGRLPGPARGQEVLRAARSSRRACWRRRRPTRSGTWRACIRGWRAAPPSSASSRPACSPCATSPSSWCGPTRPGRSRPRRFLLEEFLLREQARGLTLPFRPPLPGGARRQALLHGHCHQKAIVGTAPTVAALRWAGFDVAEVDSGCCGMAGSFGFEREHYDLSVSLGNRRLAPAVKSAAADTEIVAPGVSCRQQIEHLAGRPARHPAQVLRDALSA